MTREEIRQIQRRITERMMANVDKLRIARCPQCERILETPCARQCLWCKNKFHDKPRSARQKIQLEVVEREDGEGEEVPRITKVRVRTEL